MAKSAHEIVSLFEYLKSTHSLKHRQMSRVGKTYSGGIHVALPELNANEMPAVANVLRIGIRGFSQRIASVAPMTVAPPLRPGFKVSEAKASARRQAVDGWRTMNNDTAKRRRRALYLTAYATTPVSISPVSADGDKRNMPYVRVRNPLTTYTAETHDPDNIEPDYAIFVDTRSRTWLEQKYPNEMSRLRKSGDMSFDILEYVDCDETTLVVVGSTQDRPSRGSFGERAPIDGGSPYERLVSIPNRTGLCPVVAPGQIDLDGCVSQFSDLIGTYEQSAELNALLMIAVRRDVFSDEWLESIPSVSGTPEVLEQADGLMGITGVVKNGRIQRMSAVPNQAAQMMLDNLERVGRVNGGVPADWSGESGSNIRTARRGADIVGATTDMPIQEQHELLERSHDAEYRRMIACMKTYFGDGPSMFFIPNNGEIVHADYVPNDIFETDQVFAKYPLPGADLQSLTIQVGQMIGDGTLSAESGMEMDPRISNVPQERKRIQIEGLRRATLQQLEAQPIDPHKLALITKALAKPDNELEDALIEAEAELKKDQAATEAGQPTSDGTPPEEASQPGLDQSPEAAALAKQTALGQTSGVAGATTVPPPNMGASDIVKLLQTQHPPAPAMAGASGAA